MRRRSCARSGAAPSLEQLRDDRGLVEGELLGAADLVGLVALAGQEHQVVGASLGECGADGLAAVGDTGEGLAFAAAGGKWSTFVIWAKNTFSLGRADYQRQYEPILYGWRPGAAHAWYGGRTLTTIIDDQPDIGTLPKKRLVEIVRGLFEETTVLRHPRPQRNAEHPTMKPVGLLELLLDRSTRPGGLVLDTCAGSGSLLIACHATSRRAALVELEEKYADVICRRYQEHTGTLPTRDGTPVDFTRQSVDGTDEAQEAAS